MAIDLDVHGNTKPLEAAVQAAVNRIRRQPIKITVDDKGATQPLGNMKRGADEFTKSMEAANARILAFGASMAIINGVANAFKGMVKNLVEVEKAMADVNVVMGLSAQNLEKFSDGLFKVAKETGAAFRVAADAATEYARQGLGVEESLKRTRDALVLTRLTGMDSAEAVKSLTAAMNTYGTQIKDTTQLVSKFAAVDVKFAVSAQDFADAISRTGQSAQSAGVSIDELVGIVTAAQQKTARGGAVIGNALKTIFTKTGKTDTLNQLENLGIAVRDLEGNTIGAQRILNDLANTFDTLSAAQKSQITQTMGGLFHINILKAVLSDAAKENGIMAEATRISASATDEAIQKNEELRKTMSAVATETGLAIKQVSTQIGEIALAPGMEKILNSVKSLAEGLSGVLGDGESTGSSFATGLLKGIGNVITGPGLVVLAGVFFKLFGQALKFTKESLTSLVGVTTEKQKQKAIQTSLVSLFGQNAALNKEMLRTDIGRTEKEKIILGLLKAQNLEAKSLSALTAGMAGTLYRKGYGANLTPVGKKASGHIPNYANPERAQAAQGGYAAGSIRSMNMPGEGSVIYNSAEKVKNFKGMSQPAIMPPQSSKAGKNYQQAFGSIHGFDPYAAGGYVPNYVQSIEKRAYNRRRTGNKRTTSNTSDIKKINLNNLFPGVSQMGVLLGFGPGDSAGPQEYKQKYSSLSAPAKTSLNKKLKPSLVKQLSKKGAYSPLVSATLKTKPVYEVSDGDASRIEKILGESTLEKKLYKHVGQGFDRFSHEVGVDMFGGKIGKAGVGVLKTHMDGSMLGGILEAAIRGSLSNKKVSDSQAPFDFIGEDAKNVAKFIGDDKLRYIEAKLHKSAAAGSSGKLPMKVLNEFKAYGHIPNFADPLSDAIGREKSAGVPVSQIRVGSHGALMGKGNPLGLGVTNTHDEPNGLRDVFGANGFVPNYAEGFTRSDVNISGRNLSAQDKLVKELNRKLKVYIDKFKEGSMNQQQLNNSIAGLSRKTKNQSESSEKVTKASNEGIGYIGKLNAARKRATRSLGLQNAGQRFAGTKMGKRLSGTGAQMGLMMGLPMAAGFIQDNVGGQLGAGLGGAMSGAGTGAQMGMVFGPLGTAIGAAVGGLYGLVDGLSEAEEAARKKAKEEIENSKGMGSSLVSVFSQFPEIKQNLKEFRGQYNKIEALRAEQAGIGSWQTNVIDMESGETEQTYVKDPKAQKEARKYRAQMGDLVDAEFGEALKSLPEDYQFSAVAANPKETFTGTGKQYIKELEKVSNPKRKTAMYESFIETQKAEEAQQEKLNKEKARGIIIQLNLQKAQIQAQRNAADAQLNIKSKYLQQSNILEMQEKLMGGLMTEQQKAQLKYNKSINKAAEAFDQAEATASATLKTGILQQVGTSSNLQQELKEVLQAKGEGAALVQDISDKVAGMSADELLDTLRKIQKENQGNVDIQQAINLLMETELQKRQNSVDLAQRQKDIAEGQASSELKINNALANRAQILSDLERGSRMGGEQIRHDQKMRGLDSQLGIAQRLTNIGPGYQTGAQQEDFQINEKRIAMEGQVKTLEENRQQALKQQEIEKAKVQTVDTDRYFSLLNPEGGVITDEDQEEIANINKLIDEREKKLAEIEQKTKNINKETEEEISNAQKLLNLEKQRLAEKRKHETGPGAFGNGISDGMAKVREQVKTMDYELGERIPGALADGLATAMSEGLSGAKDIGEALRDAGISFLQMIQQAMMQKAASNIVSMLPFSRGGNVRKYSQGGGVPAMVSNGEYVMGSDAVAKYGGSFMHGLNAGGKIPGYSNGGEAPKIGEKAIAKLTSHMPTREDKDKNLREAVEKHLLSKGDIRRENSYTGPVSKNSALSKDFGGANGFKSGRAYQSKAMSGFFYSQSGNVGLGEDASAMGSIVQEKNRVEEEIHQKAMEKHQKRMELVQAAAGAAISAGISWGAGKFGQAGKNPMSDTSLSLEEAAFKADAIKNPTNYSLDELGMMDLNPDGSIHRAGWNKALDYASSAGSKVRSLFGFKNKTYGGSIRKYASGGHISGKSGIDQIPAMLSEGEYVIRASSARQLGKPMLDRINAGKFNQGGAVSELVGSSETAASSGNTNNINISINMERGSGSKQETQKQGSAGQNPADRSNEEQNSSALAERIKQQVVAVIAEEQRPGGLLSD